MFPGYENPMESIRVEGMPRARKAPGQHMKFLTVGFTPEDMLLIQSGMDATGESQSAVIRMLLRAGARGPATSPFTPAEGTDDDQ